MMGRCKLRSDFMTTEGENVDSAWSEEFLISDTINITLGGKLGARPGEDVSIIGQVTKLSGELLSEGSVEVVFGDSLSELGIISGEFEYKTKLDEHAESGFIPVTFVAKDKYGNYADTYALFRVIPIPTKIENQIEDSTLIPGEKLKSVVTLYDQNDKVINGDKIAVKIFDSEENLVFKDEIENMGYIEFKIENTLSPGSYYLLSSAENARAQSNFIIEEFNKIGVEQSGSSLDVENIGNVAYDNKMNIVLKEGDKEYKITKKVILNPRETIDIDLSKEVPSGTYDITIPGQEFLMENSTIPTIEDVHIEDNRSVWKKTYSGMSFVTGAAIETAGYVAEKPLLTTLILSLIIIGTVAYYSKNYIIKKIKKENPDDTSNLFDDYKYIGKK
jgi:hypothetical protein